MAFDATKVNRIHVGGRSLILYVQATDALAAMIASGYFNDISDSLLQGDVIIAVNTATPTVDMLVVTSADHAATVTTANGT